MYDHIKVEESRKRLANSIYDLFEQYVGTYGADGNEMTSGGLDIDLVKRSMSITVDSDYSTNCHSYIVPVRATV